MVEKIEALDEFLDLHRDYVDGIGKEYGHQMAHLMSSLDEILSGLQLLLY